MSLATHILDTSIRPITHIDTAYRPFIATKQTPPSPASKGLKGLKVADFS